jgi:hypothetical protein
MTEQSDRPATDGTPASADGSPPRPTAQPAPAPTPSAQPTPQPTAQQAPSTAPASSQTEQLLQHLHQLEPLLASVAHGAAHEASRVLPAWKRATAGELRWPVSLVVAGMVTLQLLLPQRFSLTNRWLLPCLEAALMLLLAVSHAQRISGAARWTRWLGLTLIAVASLANGWSATQLVVGLVHGSEGKDPTGLLVTGGNIWLTNIIVFGLWYWELDRGGPGARALGRHQHPDFLFPEMTAPELAEHDWEPQLVDYLYVAFTNATAFSPTDTLPFSRWSKVAMMLQSTISLGTGALVIARAVNILP